MASKSFGKMDWDKVVWTCIVIISLLEAIFQVVSAPSSWERPLWADIYVGLHLFAFSILQLYVFKRYDFASMYMFRIAYYVSWHLVWGYVRLHVLF